MFKEYGPLLTDENFFGRCVDSDITGFNGLHDAVKRDDYVSCRKIFADYIQRTLQPEMLFSCLPQEKCVTEELVAKAELAMKHIMTACEIPCDFGADGVDWFSNPTCNGYKEWTWQLSRHEELLTLRGHTAKRETKDMPRSVALCLIRG